ncbi:helix-hairpin-helix domain-containing protein [Vagococcus elongatus]|uniref:helix-hairpin-helix domain-containing protein n=1 Tax=Vagococcus elongatus TaxID=180344 RepID=UPI001FEB7C81|nr:helix-hairpin-helix domain-containing protein [Vagococcus elongatus]
MKKRKRWLDYLNFKVVMLIFLSVFLLIILFRSLNFNKKEIELENQTLFSTGPAPFEETETTQSKEVGYIDVKGAVHQPGMYEFSSNMRVQDGILLAGGFTETADQNQVNLAQLLTDQMVVYVPEKGEKQAPDASQPVITAADPDKKDKVNINSSDALELQTLNGIGEKKAEAIIQYREEQGSFKSLEDLKKVKGIGEKTFDSLRESITID